jgi:hypothetical protein
MIVKIFNSQRIACTPPVLPVLQQLRPVNLKPMFFFHISLDLRLIYDI